MTPTRMPLAEMIAAVELARDLRRSQAEAFRRSALDALSLSSPDGTTASYQRDARKIAKQADALDAVLASLRERETPQEEPPASLAREAPPPMTPPQERETLIAGLEQVRDETIQGRAADLARWDDTAERLFRERLLLLDACLAHLRAEPPTESEIDCPACGETVKQVASATLGLALWQHWNWTCQKRAERTPPEPPYKETLSRWRSAVRLYVEWTGGVHVDDCPEDDTCECDGKPANDGINALMRDLDALIAEAESSPSPARGARTPDLTDEMIRQMRDEAEKAHRIARLVAKAIGCTPDQCRSIADDAWVETIRSFLCQAGVLRSAHLAAPAAPTEGA